MRYCRNGGRQGIEGATKAKHLGAVWSLATIPPPPQHQLRVFVQGSEYFKELLLGDTKKKKKSARIIKVVKIDKLYYE